MYAFNYKGMIAVGDRACPPLNDKLRELTEKCENHEIYENIVQTYIYNYFIFIYNTIIFIYLLFTY